MYAVSSEAGLLGTPSCELDNAQLIAWVADVHGTQACSCRIQTRSHLQQSVPDEARTSPRRPVAPQLYRALLHRHPHQSDWNATIGGPLARSVQVPRSHGRKRNPGLIGQHNPENLSHPLGLRVDGAGIAQVWAAGEVLGRW